MIFRLCSLLLFILTGPALAAAAQLQSDYLKRDEAAPASSLRVSNHHSFPIREPVRFELPPELAAGANNLLAVSHSVSGGTVEAHYLPIQLDEGTPEGEPVTAWLDVQLRPNESRVYTFQDVGGSSSQRTPTSVTETFASGLPSKMTWHPDTEVELFDLSLLEIVEGLETFAADRAGRIKKALANPLPATFKLQEETHGAVKSTFTYTATATATGANDYTINVRYDLFSSGITDIDVHLETSESRAGRGYLAVAKHISSQPDDTAALQSKGGIHTPVERGTISSEQPANWFSWGDFDEGENRAVLAQAPPSITRAQGNRFHAANSPLVAETLLGADRQWVMLAEISRENPTAKNLPSFVLPKEDEPLHLRYRVLPAKTRSLEETDQAFVSFAGYQGRHEEEEEFHVSFGTGGVSFGNTYSPHLSHGENWDSFKEEIRRDMRIANALGVDWIRIQNIDAPDPRRNFLTTKKGKWMLEYLDFMAETARETGLKIFLAFSLNPQDSEFIAKRLGDTVAFYEIGKSALDQGIPLDHIEHWNNVRDAIKTAQPGASVIVTGGPRSLPLFDRLEQLGFEVDAVGQKLAENNAPTELVADQTIALGGYATRTGKMPFTSADLWQTSPRDSEGSQANEFFRTCDALLSSRNVPLLLQADLGETLRPDRTPTVQAQAYHEIIRRYALPDNRIKVLEVTMPLLTVRPGQETTLPVTLKNLTSRPLEIRLNARLPERLTTDAEEEVVTVRPRGSSTIERTIRAADDLAPGFYHIFEEARFEDTVRLGWTYASHRAAPTVDLTTEPSDGVRHAGGLEELGKVNLANLRHVVFGSNAADLEVDRARQLQNALRRATGASIQRWPDDQIDESRKTRSLLLVGNQETNSLIAEIAERLPLNPLELPAGEGAIMVVEHPKNPNRFLLVVSGKDASGIGKAAADLLGRIGG